MKIDYFKEGLLRKGKIDKKAEKGSIELAKRFLERARGNLKIKYFDVAFSLAYNSMFHSARALLFSLGIKERSHAAMIGYLKEEFRDNKEILNFLETLDSYRIARHGIQYRGEFCSELDSEEAIKDAKSFVMIVKRYFHI